MLDFQPEDISESYARTFTDRVRTALVSYSQFEVMEREKFEAIMEEQKIQLSGLCDEDCVVEVGQIAGVQYMLSGNIRDLGQTIYVAGRIIDVETSKIMASQDLTVTTGDVQALLREAPVLADALMQQFAEKKGLVAGGSSTIVDATNLGKLKLTVSESEFQLIIDGRSRGIIPRTELSLQLAPGQHEIQVSKNGFQDWISTVPIQAGGIIERRAVLVGSGAGESKAIDWSLLTVTSTPDQALVVIDGIEYGQTFLQDQIAPGTHSIQISKPLYYTVIKEVTLDPGELLPLEVQLKPNFGSVAISTQPTGARIMINDRLETAKTPHIVKPLQSGQYQLTLSYPDYRDHTQTLVISDEVEAKVKVDLIPAFGFL
jgi:TolB-like protein